MPAAQKPELSVEKYDVECEARTNRDDCTHTSAASG